MFLCLSAGGHVVVFKRYRLQRRTASFDDCLLDDVSHGLLLHLRDPCSSAMLLLTGVFMDVSLGTSPSLYARVPGFPSAVCWCRSRFDVPL